MALVAMDMADHEEHLILTNMVSLDTAILLAIVLKQEADLLTASIKALTMSAVALITRRTDVRSAYSRTRFGS
jgi:hypothetical protein